MCSLSRFPVYSDEDDIPLCEVNGKIHCSTIDFLNLHLYTNCVTNYPKIVITKDSLQQSLAKLYPGEVFLPGSDSLLQKLQDAWYENGIGKVFETIENQNNPALAQIGKSLKFLLKTYEKASHLNPFGTEKYFEQKQPSEIVLCMAWHPRCTKLAVATKDDTITIYSDNSTVTPILKAKAQRRVSTIAWRPLTSGELAVACSAGVYVWTIDPNSVISRPSFNSTLLLPDKYVTSICWSPKGDILMTCNGRDSTMTAWDPDAKKSIALKRGRKGSISKLAWSPDGSKLLSATSTRIFRVWNCSDWRCENWITLGGNVTHCVWSNDGSALLFTTSSEHCLYHLPSKEIAKYYRDKDAYLVADLTKISVNSRIVGGQVKGMAWDKMNRYLAIIFQDSPVISIFYTICKPSFQIHPGFFIWGLPTEIPIYVCFQNNFSEGANLTICWSTGRVQYFPCVFPNAETNKIAQHKSAHLEQSLYVSFNSP